LAEFNEKYFNIKQNQGKNEVILKTLGYISQSLESYLKHYWLAGGTLLGWYRNCGIIPYTNDVDIAIWSDEYNQIIEKHFTNNEKAKLKKVFGTLNDSYELRVNDNKYNYDIFVTYKIGEEKQWCGYQVKKKFM
jgi:phosphorylcholine metabolism protein LicD